jgi:O-antigen/teichoic acid export membrane protein
MGYKKSAIKGISWMSGDRFVSRGFTFLKIIILARVLSPLQFGLFGIASLILSLLETLTETGINVVLIQSKAELTEYINSAWVVSIIRGILIALVIIITSPLISYFFRAPGSIGILLFISMVPFVRGFINPAEVRFQKELNFRLQFWFDSGLFLIDATVCIVIVLITHSVYSMVWGMLVSALVEVVLSMVFIKPRPKFSIEKNYFKEMLHKGILVTGYTMFNYFSENLDNVVVGNVLGASSLGFYQMAYKISILPLTEVSNVVSSVVFPVYTKITSNKVRLRFAYLKTISLVFFGSALMGMVIFFFPKEIILILLGSKWLSIIPVLKILILYGVLRTLAGPASALYLSLSKQKFVIVMVFIRFLTLAALIYPFVLTYSLVGAGYAQLFSVIIELPVLVYLSYRIFRKA